MVAIFTGHIQDFNRGMMSGKNEIKVIRNVNDIRGMKFTSIIRLTNWYEDKNKVEANEYLKIRQPELFEKFYSII